jgi:MFS family permease
MFLLLRASEIGFSSLTIIVAYLAYNISFALLSYPFGRMADRKGFSSIFIFGLLAFTVTYGLLGYGFSSTMFLPLIGIFVLYGAFGAVEDGMAKAWLSLHVSEEYKATGIGFYLFFNSFALLFASFGTALIWKYAGGGVALSAVAVLSLGVIAYFTLIKGISGNQNV